MAYDRESILQEYPSEITDILKATTADPKDKAARLKVATTLARVLSFTKRRTGRIALLRIPRSTNWLRQYGRHGVKNNSRRCCNS